MKQDKVELGRCKVCGEKRELILGLIPIHPFPEKFDKPIGAECPGSHRLPLKERVAEVWDRKPRRT